MSRLTVATGSSAAGGEISNSKIYERQERKGDGHPQRVDRRQAGGNPPRCSDEANEDCEVDNEDKESCQRGCPNGAHRGLPATCETSEDQKRDESAEPDHRPRR